MIPYLITSTFFILLLSLFFMVAVVLRRRVSRLSMTFCLFGLSVSWWSFSYILWLLSDQSESAYFWCQMLVLGSTFIPVTYLQFVCELTGYRRRSILGSGYALAAVITLLNFGPAVVARVEPVGVFPHWPIAGPAFLLYLAHFLLFVIYSFWLLARKYREGGPQVRNQLLYLIIGTALGYAGCSTNFLLWVGIPFEPYGQSLGVLYILGIGYSVVKYRLLEFNELFLRLILLLLVALASASLFAHLSFAILNHDLPPANPDTFLRYLLALCTFAIVLVLVLPLIARYLDHLLATTFYGRRTRYRTQIKGLGSTLNSIEEESQLFEELMARLSEWLRPRRLALYYRSEFDTRYLLKFARGDPPAFPEMLDAENVQLLQRSLLRAGCSMLSGELRDRFSIAGSITPFLLDDDLLVPITSGNVLDGFLVLGARLDLRIYNDTDTALLETLCHQIGLTLRSRQIERRAHQVDKLVSLGTLAAGLAHELRNPLVSIKTFSTLLSSQKESGGPLEKEPFVDVVQRDIARISGIIESVAAFAENSEVNFSAVDIDDVVDKTLEIQRHRMDRLNIEFQYRSDDPPPVRGNFNQLLQVFINLIENAIAAMEHTSQRRLTLETRTVISSGSQTWLEISLRDTGDGIPRELQERIFDPFVTTKATGARSGKTGVGLGLAIVKRIIEAHQGRIAVESIPGEGTLFRLGLPVEDHNHLRRSSSLPR